MISFPMVSIEANVSRSSLALKKCFFGATQSVTGNMLKKEKRKKQIETRLNELKTEQRKDGAFFFLIVPGCSAKCCGENSLVTL